MKTYAVDLHATRVYVRTDDTVEAFDFRTKRQADKKLLELIKDGYKFDPKMYAATINPDYVPTW